MVKMHQNGWGPDTCGCHLLFEYDLDLPEAQRTHTYLGTIRTCPYHQSRGLSGQALWDAVQSENKRKNTLHTLIEQVKPDFNYDEYMGGNNGSPFWGYNENGAIVITCPARITAQQKAALQTLADDRFGIGKVIIQ